MFTFFSFNKMLLSIITLVVASVSSSYSVIFEPIRGRSFPVNENEIFDDPLFLTPLLEEGKYKKAQHLSKVNPDIGNTTSYSGFFTVNKECDSNLFFWFFPAQEEKWEEAPLVLWLQGGPGSTSMYGLFEELGPFEYYKELKKRQYSWNVKNNLLFIDQPVGVGYSFTGKKCYPQNETAVGADLYEAVLQFHQLFPSFQTNRFYIAGESYAGHYIPALAYTILKKNATAEVKINLVAMMIGDGWVDPVSQVDYGSYLYQLGFIDDNQKSVYEMYKDRFVKQVESEQWAYAVQTSDAFTGSLYNQFVGSDISVYNFLPPVSEEKPNWDKFIQSHDTRKALHVGKLPFQGGEEVSKSLYYDVVHSVKPWVEELLEVYPIVFYNGEVDIICAYPMTINFLRNLTWSGQTQYLNATRNQWCVDGELAGYYKGIHNLYDVLVRAAGHMVPKDQSYWAYELVNSITSGSPENPLHGLTGCKK